MKNIFLDKKNNRQGYEEVEIAGKFYNSRLPLKILKSKANIFPSTD